MSSLTINNTEVVELAHRLAFNTGESVVQTIKFALQEREERLYPKPKIKRDMMAARKLIRECGEIVRKDNLSYSFDELYDENGLPK